MIGALLIENSHFSFGGRHNNTVAFILGQWRINK